MKKRNVKIGVVPTIRALRLRNEAIRIKRQIFNKISGFGVEIIDIDDINEEGVLLDPQYEEDIINKLKKNDVDGLFFPHVNFGSEDLVAKVAKAIDKPVLIWGPRDEAPTTQGDIMRYSQTGIFATGKILRRFNVPFSYINNCALEDIPFEKGFQNFLSVCSIIKAFKQIRILQISTRPSSFWSMIINEGELLEKFNIHITPITLVDIITLSDKIREDKQENFKKVFQEIKSNYNCSAITTESIEKITSLKIAIKSFVQSEKCNAVAIQCWTALHDSMGIMPCAVNGMLFDEGIPCTCETDIHGAISSILLQEADISTPVFFADLTMRHPENDNAELLWHCGNFPHSVIKEGSSPKIGDIAIFDHHCPGAGHWELKDGDVTICRFDSDHGDYKLLIGEGKAIKGPYVNGTYVWFEVDNWPTWERKIVMGPYVHHVAGIHARVAPVLYEACRYINGLEPDPIDPSQQEIEQYLIDYKRKK
jgi:L-fucose isomerase-like protein